MAFGRPGSIAAAPGMGRRSARNRRLTWRRHPSQQREQSWRSHPCNPAPAGNAGKRGLSRSTLSKTEDSCAPKASKRRLQANIEGTCSRQAREFFSGKKIGIHEEKPAPESPFRASEAGLRSRQGPKDRQSHNNPSSDPTGSRRTVSLLPTTDSTATLRPTKPHCNLHSWPRQHIPAESNPFAAGLPASLQSDVRPHGEPSQSPTTTPMDSLHPHDRLRTPRHTVSLHPILRFHQPPEHVLHARSPRAQLQPSIKHHRNTTTNPQPQHRNDRLSVVHCAPNQGKNRKPPTDCSPAALSIQVVTPGKTPLTWASTATKG